MTKIQKLEGELLRLQKSNTSKDNELADYLGLDAVGYAPKKSLFDQSDTEATDTDGKLLPYNCSFSVKNLWVPVASYYM